MFTQNNFVHFKDNLNTLSVLFSAYEFLRNYSVRIKNCIIPWCSDGRECI